MYVFSDIHGNYSIWQQIKEYINSAPTICLGDVADRGPDGYKIIKEVLTMPNIIYLKGNHEELFIQAAREIYNCNINEGPFSKVEDLIMYANNVYNEAVALHLINGDFQTLTDFVNDGMNMKLINQLARLPLSISLEYEAYPVYDICHAGCSTAIWQQEKNYLYRKSHLLQSRAHFNEQWINGHILIHGHTWFNKIIQQLGEKQPREGELPIYNGNKICLDMRTFKTGKAMVLELPSLKHKIFEEKT